MKRHPLEIKTLDHIDTDHIQDIGKGVTSRTKYWNRYIHRLEDHILVKIAEQSH